MAKEVKEKQLKSKQYDVSSGVLKRKGKFCPKCGPGVFMATHKDRYSCGKCGYMEKKN
jgi:ubiquitin-small subunit ribosomal protein S27Ae